MNTAAAQRSLHKFSREAASLPVSPTKSQVGFEAQRLVNQFRKMAKATNCFANAKKAATCFRRLKVEYPELFKGYVTPADSMQGVVRDGSNVIAVANENGEVKALSVPVRISEDNSTLPEIQVSEATRNAIVSAAANSTPGATTSTSDSGVDIAMAKPAERGELLTSIGTTKQPTGPVCQQGLFWDPKLETCVSTKDQETAAALLKALNTNESSASESSNPKSQGEEFTEDEWANTPTKKPKAEFLDVLD